jgi:tetratricopeptide (TPR) repeat protein
VEPPVDALRSGFDAAAAALAGGDWTRAQRLATGLIPDLPSHGGVFFIAGAAALELGQWPSAIECLSRAASLNPERANHSAQLARALVAARRLPEAMAAADRAWALVPADAMTLDALGVVYSRLNEHAKAAGAFRRLVDRHPRQAGFRFNLATSLIFCGNVGEAELQLEECLKLDPRFWKAYPALAKLREQGRDRNHIARLLSVLPEARDPAAATYVHMALAKEYEDIGEYPEAFEHLAQAKAGIRAVKGYSIARDEALFEELRRSCPVPTTRETDAGGRDPIFVFGMPRSGTTLVDRILSSHSRVRSAGELESFGVALKAASGSVTPLVLDPDTILRSREMDWPGLGDAYLANAKPAGAPTDRFVDKLPHNFLYAAHIANALPAAKMICVRRHPLDTCLGNFRQLFAVASPYYDYSLDILDTGRYYVLFDALMSHWERLLPGRILSVEYEALVRGQEACTRRLLEFCGLDWEEGCLRFERNPMPVSSASTLQVREPMNRKSIGRWKKYEAQLAPLRRLLEDAGIAGLD